MNKTTPFVITISRQLGSGGAYIGQQLAKKLNINYADREILSEAAKRLSIVEDNLDSRDEKIYSLWRSFLEYSAFAPDVYLPPKMLEPTTFELFKAESEIIKHIAKEHSSVIIGRCGSYILREYPNHISIFLFGDMAFRNSRIQKLYNVSYEAAEKMIIQSDKERARYINTFTGKDWMDATQYDISINTSKIDTDKSVEIILKYIELKGYC
jgi:cytidylate kinase